MPKRFIFVLILAALLILGGGYWFLRIRPKASLKGYQAVFLANGQVYFGHLKDLNGSYPQLTDIFYLVRQRPLQEAAGGEAAGGEVVPGGQEAIRPEYTLIKLGNELHGPKDMMRINRKHILFVENLKEDSMVVQKIKEFKEQQ